MTATSGVLLLSYAALLVGKLDGQEWVTISGWALSALCGHELGAKWTATKVPAAP